MTKIKRLHIRGFKSFAKPIDIVFEDPYTIVIGANGSGKSNVMDALTFVLGKISAKSMRAEKSANLIFNGGKKGSPMKEAEVSIFFDNSKKVFPWKENPVPEEVKITRIIRQKGHSIYKINDETRTRQQILELLAGAKINPDGHNIILQGDIIRFTEMHPEARRELIEEISGIAMYEDRKQKALNELNRMDTKLNEATIILNERETYLRELKKDRDHALKYQELEKNIKSNKATYLHMQLKNKQEKLDTINTKITKQEEAIEKITNKTKEIREKINKNKKDIENITKDIENKSEKESVVLHKEVEQEKTQLLQSRERFNTVQAEITKVEERKRQLGASIKDINSSIKRLQESEQEISTKLNNLQEQEKKVNSELEAQRKKHFGSSSDELNKIEQKVTNQENTIIKLQEQQQETIQKKFSIDAKLATIEERKQGIKKLGKEFDIGKVRSEHNKVENDLNKAFIEESSCLTQLKDLQQQMRVKEGELFKVQAREANVKESVAYDRAIEAILALNKEAKFKNKIYGTVSQLGQVEERYAKALEVAAGSRMKSIVVDNDETASKCIAILKEKRSGIATFLPLNKIRGRAKSHLSGKGIHGSALDLVTFDKKFKDVFSHVFSSTLVVDDVQTARRIGIGKARMVTLDGDIMEISGAMIGGHRIHQRISFQDKKSSGTTKNLQEEVKNLEKKRNIIYKRKEELEQKTTKLRQKKNELEGSIVRIEKSFEGSNLNELEEEEKNLKNHEVYKQHNELEQQMAQEQTLLIQLKQERDKQRKSSGIHGESPLANSENKRAKIREEIVQLQTELKNNKLQKENIYLPEKEKTQQIIKQHDKETQEFKEEEKRLDVLIKTSGKAVSEMEKKETQFQQNYKELFNKRNKISETIQKDESYIAVEDQKIKSVEEKVNTYNIDKAKVVAEKEALEREYDEFKGVKLRQHISMDKLKDDIRKFEQMLQQIGNVNMRALEIYEDIRREYDGLLAKVDNLQKEKDDVLEMMAEIDSKKKQTFLKTFKELAKNFTDIFSQLSTKGEASLVIENKEDPLAGGIDIAVRLIGNKHLDIRSLSGGEKTLAALAFIFAIQEHEPAAFYLLDEVDAALDKKNSDLLSKFVAKYASKAQYILISHNDTVISEADAIYGVSMQENGMSKVVSLKV